MKVGRPVVRRHPGPRTGAPRRLRASWDGSALMRRDDRVRFPGGLHNQEWRSGSAALSHREGRQFESDLLDRSGGLVERVEQARDMSSLSEEPAAIAVIEVEVAETPGREPGGREFESPRSPLVAPRAGAHPQQAGTVTSPASYAGPSWFDSRCCDYAGVARVAGHLPCKQAIESSTLSAGSIGSFGSMLRSACWRSLHRSACCAGWGYFDFRSGGCGFESRPQAKARGSSMGRAPLFPFRLVLRPTTFLPASCEGRDYFLARGAAAPAVRVRIPVRSVPWPAFLPTTTRTHTDTDHIDEKR